MSSYSPPKPLYPEVLDPELLEHPLRQLGASAEAVQRNWQRTWQMFAAAAFLVSVPVFIQAPLVRTLPWISLACTLVWVVCSLRLKRNPAVAEWGDLLLGFSWTWLAGAIYWGWLRWEPLVHLPIESIGLPFAIWGLTRGQSKIGHWFYIGSLFGTAITDAYFYLVNLIPHWRQMMQVEPERIAEILHDAVQQVQTPWGIGCALILISVLLTVGSLPLRSAQLHWWVFSGAVLSTLLVDGLFWLGATVV